MGRTRTLDAFITNKWIKRIREIEPTLENHPEYNDMYQIMRINLAISTIRMTDTFGDIPYFKAGRGETLIPYDSQKDIYYDVFKELTEAVTELKQKKSNQLQYNTEDLIYQGDVDKWIKLANSLRLRAAMRLSFIDPDKAKAEGEAALKESLIASNSDNAGVTRHNRIAGQTRYYAVWLSMNPEPVKRWLTCLQAMVR